MQNMYLLEEKHKLILSIWFDKMAAEKELPRNLLIKVIKFGNEFANKKSLATFIDKNLGKNKKLDFEIVLNCAWLIKLYKMESQANHANSLLLRFLPHPKVSPEDYMRLI